MGPLSVRAGLVAALSRGTRKKKGGAAAPALSVCRGGGLPTDNGFLAGNWRRAGLCRASPTSPLQCSSSWPGKGASSW